MILPITAVAQPEHIPVGDRETVGGESLQCYDFENYKKLLIFDAAFEGCLRTNELLVERHKLEKQRSTAFEKIIALQQKSMIIIEKDNDRLFKDWKEENKKRHLAENRPMLGSYIAWSTAGAFAVATAVLSVIVIVK